MERTMISKSAQKQLDELEAERLLRDRIASNSRARALTIGTAFGGTTEVIMRTDSGQSVWAQMQPVEVVELIHQLAANIGCHVALKPRKDFASWRDWRVTDEEHERLNGWAPWVNDMAPYNQLGAKGMDPELLKALNAGVKIIESGGGVGGGAIPGIIDGGNAGVTKEELIKQHRKTIKNETVATQKAVKRRAAKQSTKTS